MTNRLKELRKEKGLTLDEIQLNAVATAYKKTIHFDFGDLKKEYGGLDEQNR